MPGVHFDDDTTGPFSLVVEHRAEQRPACIRSRQCQMPVGKHKLRRNIFNGDQCKLFGHAVGQPVQVVAALISNLPMQGFYTPFALPPARRKARLTGPFTLGAPEFLECPTQPARIINQRSVRKGQQALKADVHTYGLAAFRFGRFLSVVALERYEPAVASLARDDYVLEASFGDVAVQLDANIADVLDAKAVSLECATITVLILNGAKAAGRLKAREAGLGPFLDTAEEGRKRLVEATEKLLDGGCIEQPEILDALFAILTESLPLRRIANRLAGRLVHVPPVFQRLVVEQAGLTQDHVQRVLLRLIRVEAILVGALHLDAFLRFNVTANGLVRDLPDAASVVRARPQRGKTRLECGEPLPQFVRRVAFEVPHKLINSHSRRSGDEQMNVIGTDSQRKDVNAELGGFGLQQLVERVGYFASQYAASKLGTPDQMILKRVGATRRSTFVYHTVNVANSSFTIKKVIEIVACAQGQTTPCALPARRASNTYPPEQLKSSVPR